MKTQNKPTHTPGPWQHGGWGSVYGPGTTPNVLPNSLPTAIIVATAEMGGGLCEVHSKEERLANARLIAAAPDLLSVAKFQQAADEGEPWAVARMLADNEGRDYRTEAQLFMFLRRAAIAKAEGK